MRSFLVFSSTFFATTIYAQDNFEIQVYGSRITDEGHTMVELHSNYTLDGSKEIKDGVLPTNHVFHETVEITHGWTHWMETALYFFNTIGDQDRSNYVGSHLRLRGAVPADQHWPVGVSLSLEFGFQKSSYSANTTTLEIRPIFDKTYKRLYVSFNPTVDQSFKGPDQSRGLIFSPNLKASYNVNKIIALGFEYYGSVGPFFNYDPYDQQQHQIFIVSDINLGPQWEFNVGYGYSLNNATDKAIFKTIFGRRF